MRSASWLLLSVLLVGCVDDPVTPSADLASVEDAGSPDLSPAVDLLTGPDLLEPDLLFVPPDGGITPPSFQLAATGLAGGAVLDVALNTTALYALTAFALFRSTNDGLSWTQLPPVAPGEPPLRALAAARLTDAELYVTTQDDRLFRSADDGLSWEPVDLTGGPTIFSVLYLDQHGSALWVANGNTLHRKIGTVWSAIDVPAGPSMFGESDDPTPQLFYGANNGIYQLSEPSPGSPVFIKVASSPGATRLFVTGKATGGTSPLRFAAFRSMAPIQYFDGATWDTSVPDIGYDVHPADLGLTATRYFAFGQGAIRSWPLGSGQADWTVALALPATHLFRGLVAGNLYVGTSAGLLMSTNHLTWQLRVTGMQAVTATRLRATIGEPDRLYAGTEQGLFRSVDRGASWVPLDTLPAYAKITDVALANADPQRLYVAIDGRLFVSSNGGDGFTQLTQLGGASEVSSVAVSHGQSNRVLVCVDTKLRASFDSGASFGAPTFGSGTSDSACQGVVFDPSNALHAYAITDGQLVESTDGGGSFTQAPGAAMPVQLNALVQPASDPNRLYFIGDGELRWYQGGQTQVATLSSTFVPRDVAIDPANPKIVYLATSLGLLVSTDRALTFSPMNDGLVSRPLSSVFVHPGDRRLRVVGVEASGIYRSEGMLQP